MKNTLDNLAGNRFLPLVAVLIAIPIWLPMICSGAGPAPNGEQIYKENCASCHTGGGNIIDPKKPVKGSAKLSSKNVFKGYLLKPSGAMAAVPKLANDAPTLDALYKYCKTLK